MNNLMRKRQGLNNFTISFILDLVVDLLLVLDVEEMKL